MSTTNGNTDYQVSGVKVTQGLLLDRNGRPATAFTVTFSVGIHGPFTVMFSPESATPENIRDAILAQVNALRAQDALIAQLNATGTA